MEISTEYVNRLKDGEIILAANGGYDTMKRIVELAAPEDNNVFKPDHAALNIIVRDGKWFGLSLDKALDEGLFILSVKPFTRDPNIWRNLSEL